MHRRDENAATPLGTPPWESLHEQLLAHADDLDAAGQEAGAAAVRAIVAAWWSEQQRWTEQASAVCALHHEINNALVGVSGNVQILLRGPAGEQPALRERLQVVLRESQRISDASLRLRDLRVSLGGARSTESSRQKGAA